MDTSTGYIIIIGIALVLTIIFVFLEYSASLKPHYKHPRLLGRYFTLQVQRYTHHFMWTRSKAMILVYLIVIYVAVMGTIGIGGLYSFVTANKYVVTNGETVPYTPIEMIP